MACLIALSLLLACSGKDDAKGAVFTKAGGTIELAGATRLKTDLQRARDYPEDRLTDPYVAPIVNGSVDRVLEMRLETADGNGYLAVLMRFNKPGTFNLTRDAASLDVLLGEDCDGASGNIFAR